MGRFAQDIVQRKKKVSDPLTSIHWWIATDHMGWWVTYIVDEWKGESDSLGV